jgi:hypothetical protein
MAKLTVNIGTSANDRTGDNLRTAFNKINTNFTELYTALGLDSDTTLNLGAFEFTGSVMTTTDSSAITIDQAVTVSSDLTVGGDVVPSTDFGSSLGSSTKRFKDLYLSSNTIYIGNTNISIDSNGDLSVGGSAPYSDSDVASYLNGNVSNSIVPDTDIVYDLGSPTKRFKDLYLSGSTIKLDGATISASGTSVSISGLSETAWKPTSINDWGGDSLSGDKTGWRVIDYNTYEIAWRLYRDTAAIEAFPVDPPGAPEAYWSVWNTKWTPAVYTPVWSGDNLSSITITTPGEYPNTTWMTVNTDNMFLINGGGDGSMDQADLTAIGQVIEIWQNSGLSNGNVQILGKGVESTSFTKLATATTTIPGYISITELKAIVAASTDFDDFKARIAAL